MIATQPLLPKLWYVIIFCFFNRLCNVMISVFVKNEINNLSIYMICRSYFLSVLYGHWFFRHWHTLRTCVTGYFILEILPTLRIGLAATPLLRLSATPTCYAVCSTRYVCILWEYKKMFNACYQNVNIFIIPNFNCIGIYIIFTLGKG